MKLKKPGKLGFRKAEVALKYIYRVSREVREKINSTVKITDVADSHIVLNLKNLGKEALADSCS